MMVVITMTSCPVKLRGDLTRWMIEIDTGVFTGNLSARVRDEIWGRVCKNINNGHASMAFSTNGEQKLDFRICNTNWVNTDYDGIQLVKRKYETNSNDEYKKKSNINIHHINRLSQKKDKAPNSISEYVVIDIETTGLNDNDKIIELGALKIKEGEITEQLSQLIKCEGKLSDEIVKLTGITNEMLEAEGENLYNGLKMFINFCGKSKLVGYNVRFDMDFLQRECKANSFEQITNELIDVMKIVKRKNSDISGYSLASVAEYYKIDYLKKHRALEDCLATYRIFEKLNEN